VTRKLSLADVLAVLDRVPDALGLVLVGGQALNFWAERLAVAGPDSQGAFGPVVSNGIDFLGSPKAALSFNEAVGGDIKLAGFDDAHSPNAALVTIDYEGETSTIDFLRHLAGFTNAELDRVRRNAVPVRIPGNAAPSLHVLHPVHCLQSQLENVYGEKLNRRADSERYIKRVLLAVEVCRQLTFLRLTDTTPKEALAIAEAVFELALTPAALRARVEDNVRVEAGIPPDAKGFPAGFAEQRWPQMQAHLEEKLRKYRNALARRRVRPRSGA
jgi:hypothetical protein